MFPRKGFGYRGNHRRSAFDTGGSKREKELESYVHELMEKNKAAEKKAKEKAEKKAEKKRAAETRFGGYHSEDSDGAGAPVIRKRKNDSTSDSSSSASSSDSEGHHKSRHRRHHKNNKRAKRVKQEIPDEDEPQNYHLLQHLNYNQPQTLVQTTRDRSHEESPVYSAWRPYQQRNNHTNLDAERLDRNRVEWLFPYKEPLEVGGRNSYVYQVEGARYDPRNDASVSAEHEDQIDYENMPFEEFRALEIIKQNTFAQSSPMNKSRVYRVRLGRTNIISEKVEYYSKLISLEDDLIKEQRRNGTMTGRFDVIGRKLSMLQEALRDCGEHVELRLVEIEILTEKHGVNSVEVETKWDAIMNKFPNDLKMWRRRLTYYRSKRSIFSAESYFKKSVLKCLEKLGGIVAGDMRSHPKQEGTDEFLMDVIVSAAVLHIELGATHKAIAILQALIEFYFMCHKHLDMMSFKDKLYAFECFWKSGIPKIGNQHAKGWRAYSSNPSFTNYDYPENFRYRPMQEQEERRKQIEGLLNRNIEYMKSVNIHSESQQWSTIEKSRTESLWEPYYIDESIIGGLRVTFNEIKPYLVQLESDKKAILQQAIFRILGRLGAVIPDQIDNSQESIFNQCDIILKEESFKLQFVGIHDFIDNVLSRMSASNDTSGQLYLFSGIARIMTRKSALVKKASTCSEAINLLTMSIREIRDDLKSIRVINSQESLIMASYISQMIEEINVSFGNTLEVQEDRFPSITQKNIFHTTQSKIAVFAQLRYLVMCCRSLPYHDEISNFGQTSKLKFLLQVVLNQENPDIHSKDLKNDAIALFKESKLIESDFNLPAAANWIGNPKAFAIELFALLCYEAEEEGLRKFDAFAVNFNAKLLDEYESLTEVFFLTWEHFLHQYRQEKTEFMSRLKTTIIKFPRNVRFTQMLGRHMANNPMELRYYFATHEVDDDIVKILRSCVEASLISTDIVQCQDNTKRKSLFFNIYNVLQGTAELSLNSLIPESFLWRMLLLYVKQTNGNFDEVFLLARDQCSWSKILLMYAAFLNTRPDFLANNIDYAKRANMSILCDEADLRELK